MNVAQEMATEYLSIEAVAVCELINKRESSNRNIKFVCISNWRMIRLMLNMVSQADGPNIILYFYITYSAHEYCGSSNLETITALQLE